MILNNFRNLIKIFLVLVFAFLISSFAVKDVFLADSPKIRPNLGNYFLAKINETKDNILARLNFNFSSNPSVEVDQSQVDTVAESQNNNTTTNFLKKSLSPITKGVSAASQGGYSYTEFKLNEIEWVQITYTLSNGKTITIQYPKGTEPPPQEIYENIDL